MLANYKGYMQVAYRYNKDNNTVKQLRSTRKPYNNGEYKFFDSPSMKIKVHLTCYIASPLLEFQTEPRSQQALLFAHSADPYLSRPAVSGE